VALRLTHLNATPCNRRDDARLRHRITEERAMRNSVGGLALAAALVLSAAAVQADDKRDWGPRWPMVPGYGMGQGYGMGPGYGQGYGPGYGPGYGMGPGMMGPGATGMGGMRGFGGRPPVDPDHDGIVSNTEAATHFEEAFMAMDGDDDGTLTLEEFSSVFFGQGPHMAWRGDGVQQWQERKEARFKEMDANKDNTVTREEFIAYGKNRFEESDRDKDGKVTVWEFMARRHYF
jgi:hypothetical protein